MTNSQNIGSQSQTAIRWGYQSIQRTNFKLALSGYFWSKI